eukprot:NODE_4624_length_783_cov_6.196185_g3843_i0.p1 GENE.NODE_4624_length_783_cov_6.196185_g3843_i0~~NODE_4624_length_783_cov_6.196185_g3843_i0.p1  ORF type:complete len:204 (-),score=49.40 NODE_4624_length_783_cov_6.196185_g3843_i0:38-649(-)
MVSRAFLLLLLGSCTAFQFPMSEGESKCFTEELPEGNTLSGEIDVKLESSGHAIDFTIENPHRVVVVKKTSINGHQRFETITTAGGEHTLCFFHRILTSTVGQKAFIDFNVNLGPDEQSVEHQNQLRRLKPIEVELRLAAETVQKVHHEYLYFKQREAELRNLNEATNSRSVLMSVGSALFAAALAGLQVLHLKKFFISKKML